MTKLFPTIFLSIFIVSWCFAQEPDKQVDAEPKVFSLNEAVDYAIENSNQVKSSYLDIDYAKGQIKEYTSIGLPQVEGKVDYNYFVDVPVSFIPPNSDLNPTPDYIPVQFGTKNQLNAELTLTQLILDGSYFVGLKAARGLKKLNQTKLELTKYDLKYLIQDLYQTVLIVDESIKIVDSNLINVEKTLNETKEIYKNTFS